MYIFGLYGSGIAGLKKMARDLAENFISGRDDLLRAMPDKVLWAGTIKDGKKSKCFGSGSTGLMKLGREVVGE